MANHQMINNDLIIERILLRAPASSLLRYQLVCKKWWGMIQEARFKKEHAELHNKTNEPLRLLVLKIGDQSEVFCEKHTVNIDVNLTPLWMPQDLGSDRHFGGSCNGLVCTEVEGEITVFNPFTQEVMPLPKPTHIKGYGLPDKNERMQTDFVFHSATGEYKVMLFYQNDRIRPFCSVSMYTLGANSNSTWRNVYWLPRFPLNHGVNVEDTIYWPCLSPSHGTDIICLDLSTEKICFINSPIKDAMLTGLTKWHGKLCGVSFQKENATINLWTLDYNRAEAEEHIHMWTLLEASINCEVLAPYNSIKQSRVYFVESKNTLICHDLSTNDLTVVKYNSCSSTCEIMNCFAYVETLLPVPPA